MTFGCTLTFNYGYAWFTASGISVKGFIDDEKKGLLENEALVKYFEGVTDRASFLSRLQHANGLYSVIIRLPDQVLLAVDPIRTFPLFYCQRNGRMMISDDAGIAAGATRRLSTPAVSQFLSAGFVSGKETLLEEVFQLEAGSYCVMDERGATPAFYHLFCSDSINTREAPEQAQALAGILDQVGKRLTGQLKGRTAVVPLSGGYDSRLIAVLLKKFQYEKVIFYTYGAETGPEVQLSRKIAAQLGHRWYFVRHDRRLIEGFVQTKAFQKYYPFAANYTSSFFTQDYFALHYLQEHRLLPDDAVIIPGHTSTFDSGFGRISAVNRENVVDKIVEKHFGLRRDISQKPISTKVARQLIEAPAAEIFENWNVKERLAKFINNANRVYEFWGYQHLMPLWDRHLSDFIRNLPMSSRSNKGLYHQVCREYFFQPAKVDLFLTQFPFPIQKVIGAKNRLKRFLWTDPINFKLIARQFQKDTPLPVKWDSVAININTIQSAWYIQKITTRLSMNPPGENIPKKNENKSSDLR